MFVMHKSLLFLLGVSVAFGTNAAKTPLQLLDSELSNVKTHSQTIKKWDCGKYKDTASTAACEYFKAYLSHQERQYDQAQKHVGALASALYRDSNFALLRQDANSFKQMVKQQIYMFDSAFKKNEDGGIDGMSVGSVVNTLLHSAGNQQNPYGSAIYTSNFIDILYDERQVKSLKHAYLRLGQDLLEWQMLDGTLTKANAPRAYQTVLSKIIPGDQTNDKHVQYVNTLWNKIPKSQRSQNLDALVAMYIQSGQRAPRQQDLKLALSELDSAESNSDDVKVRLYSIYLGSIVESIPESERMPSNGDYSKVLIRYFHLLSPELQKQYKNALNEAVNIVLSKSSPRSVIDELIVIQHVMYLDVLDVPKPKGNYYSSMDKKYSALRKDYVDFTDQSSKEYSAISYLGALSRTSLGEGLM
ncbi:hypothetical protein QYZ43_20255 [Vibrio parahaemolyticus]|uniref:hypothetical protein n=2 Tax=Vibrio parahaemolyticus TaxID=670 RepID=UPI00116E3198|nr:hypothetical protein [Vibrio parahaemolyticus]MDN4715398.1 hypothetical protein [Vibrio parahaemolyticus]MDN4719413.1 hypothetical protein [Vibrio parahaemolyticus]MDN4723581.1 hypothetical protein [Vibrio parahaemolyticus]MDN4727557.1 hypothetical protein [Vibrio parahaemolyticus]TOE52033.1 hypothetical protein CGJ42_11040 [Vibrio parahaemolyticus]